ncbi:MAG: HlyD family type I secretion periplasmic adaptor subunit [Phenylobacterium sp.]|uniref:HlyD family type I secretion periplasmic adaptor subunit n=1 Tax=Phenylobacterium sp. TaxID=1871053 RepID=UPI00391D9BD4
MKIDIGRHRDYVTPDFDGDAETQAERSDLKQRIQRPIMVGSVIVGVFVLGLGVWAAATPINSGISATGQVRVESNRKTLRHRETGTVRAIYVKEGQRVRAGQPLILFDEVQAKAQVSVLQSGYDSYAAQSARYEAEATGKGAIDFPPELMARMSDPQVAAVIRDQQFLFTSRLQLFNSQKAVLDQRMDQLDTRIEGLQSQVDAIDEQVRLTQEELAGYRTLNEKGFAPKTLILRYERSLADLAGRKGSLISDITRTREQMGETRMQLASLRDQRQSQAAEGLRDMQARLADVTPRLAAAKQTLAETLVRSPVDGYVLNLSQHTVGGVAGAGEVLMDVVPVNEPLVVSVQVRPQDIDNVRIGMDARVQLVGLNQRFVSPIPAKVMTVSADQRVDEKTGKGFFVADLRINPEDVRKFANGARLTPGMPATALIVTGKRTILAYLVSPITDTLNDAFREQ